MSVKKFYSATASEAKQLQDSYSTLLKKCEGDLTRRLSYQRGVIYRVLQKLNRKADWEDHCWPELYRWANGSVAHLTIVQLLPGRLQVEVRQRGALTGTYWIPASLLFVSDWTLAAQVREVHRQELHGQRIARLQELHKAVQADEAQAARLAREAAKRAKAHERLKRRVQEDHRTRREQASD